MIKVLLKHVIFEKCINVLFNAINANFQKAKPLVFKEGDRFKLLELQLPYRIVTFENVVLVGYASGNRPDGRLHIRGTEVTCDSYGRESKRPAVNYYYAPELLYKYIRA